MEFFTHDALAVGTKGLVFIGDDVLVYRRDDKAPKYPLYVDVPGGGAENDETPFETFKREVKEEFGLSISKDDIAYSKRYESVFEKGKFGWFAVAKLPVEAKSKIVFGDEGVEYMLMPLQEFLKLEDAWPVYQQRAADYSAYSQRPSSSRSSAPDTSKTSS